MQIDLKHNRATHRDHPEPQWALFLALLIWQSSQIHIKPLQESPPATNNNTPASHSIHTPTESNSRMHHLNYHANCESIFHSQPTLRNILGSHHHRCRIQIQHHQPLCHSRPITHSMAGLDPIQTLNYTNWQAGVNTIPRTKPTQTRMLDTTSSVYAWHR